MTDVVHNDGMISRDGILYGCHIDLADGDEPDGCVIMYGAPGDCIFGTLASGRSRRSPFTCKYWRKVGK